MQKTFLILTDKRSVTRYSRTKIIPPTLWIALDHVLSLDIIQGHIPRKANFAADYLSRIHINPKEKLKLRIKSKLQMHEIEVYIASDTPDNSLKTILEEKLQLPKITTDYLLTTQPNSAEKQTIEADVQMQLLSNHNASLQMHNTRDDFTTHGHNALNLRSEQQNDQDIKR